MVAILAKRISMLEQSVGANAHRVCIVMDDEPVPAGIWAKVLRVEFVEPPSTNQPVTESESDHGKS